MSAPAPAPVSAHRALVYTDEAELVAQVCNFLQEGADNGERLGVALGPEKLASVRSRLGRRAELVEFADGGSVPRRQGHALRALVEYLSTPGPAQRRTRIVTEQGLAQRSPAEVRDYLRVEAAATEVYRTFGVSVLCPYDASCLPEDVVMDCLRAHPELLQGGQVVASPYFEGPLKFIVSHSAVVNPPVWAPSFGCDSSESLSVARIFLKDQAQAAGLGEDTTTDLVLAATEMLSNAIVHGRAPRRVWVYREGANLVCHVHDCGPGLAEPLAAYLPPAPEAAGGRGLWMARQMCDALEVASDETGTHVRFVLATPG